MTVRDTKRSLESGVTPGDIVRSTAGRDAGSLLAVLQADGEYAVLADGKHRPLARPKRKKQKHLYVEAKGAVPAVTNGCLLTDRQLRIALAVYRAAQRTAQGGRQRDEGSSNNNCPVQTESCGVNKCPAKGARIVEEGR